LNDAIATGPEYHKHRKSMKMRSKGGRWNVEVCHCEKNRDINTTISNDDQQHKAEPEPVNFILTHTSSCSELQNWRRVKHTKTKRQNSEQCYRILAASTSGKR